MFFHENQNGMVYLAVAPSIGVVHLVTEGPPWRFLDMPPGSRVYLATETRKWAPTELGST